MTLKQILRAMMIIRNTYRTLMTRGQKGCYVYCTDSELASYLKVRLSKVYSKQKEVTELLVAEEKEEINQENMNKIKTIYEKLIIESRKEIKDIKEEAENKIIEKLSII